LILTQPYSVIDLISSQLLVSKTALYVRVYTVNFIQVLHQFCIAIVLGRSFVKETARKSYLYTAVSEGGGSLAVTADRAAG
jgi:uncharacterized membrane protein